MNPPVFELCSTALASQCNHSSLLLPNFREGASLVAQLVKNLPAMRETWVQFLGQENLLDKEMATHSSVLA